MMDQPSITFLNSNSQNRLTVAASELVYPITFKVGENEVGDVGFDTRVSLFEYPTTAITSYRVKIRLDSKDINYNVTQRDLLKFWQTENNLSFAHIPEKAQSPFIVLGTH
ncbi:hypothetical protein [Mucilaginibacter flavidus]|uniref:hypothetical protein n=1 Tax=Mucilaginibacter flavidus TaxID=2949309 RepID=UPI0020929840|nr:hypothetical protein [Mucilaginibacter flavidus]MCO5949363.1 hypothetical protein [Mucilaginibacter flavidus]